MTLLKLTALLLVLYSAYDYGKMIGLADGAKEERLSNANRLRSCQILVSRNMYK